MYILSTKEPAIARKATMRSWRVPTQILQRGRITSLKTCPACSSVNACQVGRYGYAASPERCHTAMTAVSSRSSNGRMVMLASFTVNSHLASRYRIRRLLRAMLCALVVPFLLLTACRRKMTLLRTLLAATCLIPGSVLLIPIGLWLWRALASRLTVREIHYLPESQTDFILFLGGREIDSAAVVAAATVVGALLLLAGLRTLRSG